MPWKEVTKMDERLEFAIRAMNPMENFTKLCREFNISTKTGYKWKERFIKGGKPNLLDQPRTPQGNINSLAEDVVCDLIKVKQQYPGWGPKKILKVYKNAHPNEYSPSLSSVQRVLTRAGLTKRKKKRARSSNSRIQFGIAAERPNHVWSVDFKGWWYTPTKEKCEPLTVRDEYSKYILDIKVLEKGNIFHVRKRFEHLFKEYGLPDYIKSDNGPPFAAALSRWGLTKLAVWWMFLGISLDRIDPGKPYQNGAHERMHLDMRKELEHQIDGDLRLHQAMFDQWRNDYNNIRPHEALNMKTPAEVYTKSERKYEFYDAIDYGNGFKTREINGRGYTNYLGHRVFIGNAFNGYNIGIKEDKNFESLVYFNKLLLGIFDRKNYLFTPEEKLQIQ